MGKRESVTNIREEVIEFHDRIKESKLYFVRDAKSSEWIREAIYELYSTRCLEYIELIAYIKHQYKIKHDLTKANWDTLKNDPKIAEYDSLLDMMWENIPGCGRFGISTHNYYERVKRYKLEDQDDLHTA